MFEFTSLNGLSKTFNMDHQVKSRCLALTSKGKGEQANLGGPRPARFRSTAAQQPFKTANNSTKEPKHGYCLSGLTGAGHGRVL